jgi:hypothetical protein
VQLSCGLALLMGTRPSSSAASGGDVSAVAAELPVDEALAADMVRLGLVRA